MNRSLADDELVAFARAGSHEAFRELVERYRAPIVRFAYRLTHNPDEANDVAQDTFLRAYRGLGSFEPKRPFARWLFAIARNAAHDALRRSRRSLDIERPEASEQPGPEELALRHDDGLRLREALDALPQRYRAVLELYYLRGLLYREVSGELGIPIGTVKTYLRRAKRRMRHELSARDFDLAA